MDLGTIRKVDLDAEMQQSYLDYAMSVIVSRALPDARDGLKPVQRRILYSMYDMGLRSKSDYKKSARIVGEVLGKYHPHGDTAVYESMARLAQDFSMRYMLVDGQGNFGSVDGDPPAAMRYTEARLADASMEMLGQIDKNTVDFIPNFDQSLTEPVVLPSAIPNLLVNGATGIAVGMATNIPPHNLGEVVDALVFMLDRWEKLDDITIEDLLRFIQGPDFPTGGVIIQEAGSEGLMSAYGSGRGKITVQARAHMEEMGRGRNRIIVTELPYQVNKSALIERIADLVRENTIEGIADLRDESDRQGMRIVIELSKTAEPEKILRALYRHTPMQTTFGIILLALVDGEPHMLSLKQALRVYVEHRLTVVRRRSEYDLDKARQRAHILEGYLVALKNLDEVIQIIRTSADAEAAKLRLMKRFKLSEAQTLAVLELPLRRLASLERKKIEQEYKEIEGQIEYLEGLLKSPKKMRQVVIDELVQMKQTYGDRRRTTILNLKEGSSASALLTTTDVTPVQPAWVAVTAKGLIGRSSEAQPPAQIGTEPPRWLMHTDTHKTLFLISETGQAAAIPVHSVPELEKSPEGVPVDKVSPLSEDEPLATMIVRPATNGEDVFSYILTVTQAGMVKKSSTADLPGPSAASFTLTRVNQGDKLLDARITDGSAEILLATARGMSIRFKEEESRPMGLVAAGVAGIKLADGDRVIGIETIKPDSEILLVASSGRAKRVKAGEFPIQARYGQGVWAWKLPEGVNISGIALASKDKRYNAHRSDGSTVLFRAADVALLSRAVQGKTLPAYKGDATVVSLVTVDDGAFDEIHAGSKESSKIPTGKAKEKAQIRPGKGKTEPTHKILAPDGKAKAGQQAPVHATVEKLKKVPHAAVVGESGKKVQPLGKAATKKTTRARAEEANQLNLPLGLEKAPQAKPGAEKTKPAVKKPVPIKPPKSAEKPKLAEAGKPAPKAPQKTTGSATVPPTAGKLKSGLKTPSAARKIPAVKKKPSSGK